MMERKFQLPPQTEIDTAIGRFLLVFESETLIIFKVHPDAAPARGYSSRLNIEGSDYNIRGALEPQGDHWVTKRTDHGNESVAAFDVNHDSGNSWRPASKQIRDKVRSVVVAAANAKLKAEPELLARARKVNLNNRIIQSEHAIARLRAQLEQTMLEHDKLLTLEKE